eukprot:scaffold16378_cov206-Amphora_coffeaeformis.AAC.1
MAEYGHKIKQNLKLYRINAFWQTSVIIKVDEPSIGQQNWHDLPRTQNFHFLAREGPSRPHGHGKEPSFSKKNLSLSPIQGHADGGLLWIPVFGPQKVHHTRFASYQIGDDYNGFLSTIPCSLLPQIYYYTIFLQSARCWLASLSRGEDILACSLLFGFVPCTYGTEMEIVVAFSVINNSRGGGTISEIFASHQASRDLLTTPHT